MSSIIFSPHCDDAALSMGGALLNHLVGEVNVINVFSLSSWTITGIGGANQITKVRIEEDTSALSALVKGLTYLGLPDSSIRAPYDADEDLYLDPELDARREGIWEQASLAASNQLRGYSLQHPSIFIPLGLGDHIDHRIVRDCLLDLTGQQKTSLYLYEDVGYDDTESLEYIDQFVTCLGIKLEPKTFEFRDIKGKLDLVSLYKSQVDEAMIAHVQKVYADRGGERVWEVINK